MSYHLQWFVDEIPAVRFANALPRIGITARVEKEKGPHARKFFIVSDAPLNYRQREALKAFQWGFGCGVGASTAAFGGKSPETGEAQT